MGPSFIPHIPKINHEALQKNPKNVVTIGISLYFPVLITVMMFWPGVAALITVNPQAIHPEMSAPYGLGIIPPNIQNNSNERFIMCK